jgi:hypothetical protein
MYINLKIANALSVFPANTSGNENAAHFGGSRLVMTINIRCCTSIAPLTSTP